MKIRWPVIIVIILALALALAGGMTMMWRLFIFLIVLLAISYVWLRLLARQVEGRLEKAQQFCRVGDSFEETFTLTNNGRLPMFWCEAIENTDLPGYSNRVKFGLPSWGSYTWQSKGTCRQRGQYRVGSLKARIFDPFGFFYVIVNIGDVKYVNVLPDVLDLSDFQVLPRREPGLNTRRWFAGEPGQNASRVREYVSGDSLRYIHWHSTAHTGQLMVKEFDPDMSRAYVFNDVWIILDMHRDAVYGTGKEATTEYAITIAASLVAKYLENEKKVGFMATGDRSYMFMPDNDAGHALRINEALTMLKPEGAVHLENLIISQEDRIAAGSAVIIITPAEYQRLEAPLRLLLSRGAAVTAILLDAASFGGKIAAADTSRMLAAEGINTYIIRRGVDLIYSLNVKRLASAAQYQGILKNR
jgi:uncharacterized protein (DUF58 family)